MSDKRTVNKKYLGRGGCHETGADRSGYNKKQFRMYTMCKFDKLTLTIRNFIISRVEVVD